MCFKKPLYFKKPTLIILIIVIISVSSLSGFLGLLIGETWQTNNSIWFASSEISSQRINLWEIPRIRKFYWALREVIGIDKFYSDYGQDKWIIRSVFPGIKDGYYVDVGSADGIRSSNTKALDDMGWKGLCIDPFPTNMSQRTCIICNEAVYSVSGKKVAFRASGFTGGIVDPPESRKQNRKVKKEKTVEFETVTLDDILTKAGAPHYIHYMSIDIEGAELDALYGFSFTKYKVGAFTIEHNNEEPKRSQIRRLLESKGYRYVLSLTRDDCYVAEFLMKNPKEELM